MNIKLLTEKEKDELNNKFVFTCDENFVYVSTVGYSRVTAHDISKSFHINSKIRKINFSVEAISIWRDLYQSKKAYTLVDIQNSVNTLKLLFQEVNVDTVHELLKRRHAKIKFV